MDDGKNDLLVYCSKDLIWISFGSLILMILLLTGCVPAAPASPTPAEMPKVASPLPVVGEDQADQSVLNQSGVVDAAPLNPAAPDFSSLLESAREDLARQSGTAFEDIEVLGFWAVTWSDSSLGCPQEGAFYTQILAEGTLLRLEVDGEVYNYHSGGDGEPFLCEESLAPVGVTPMPLPSETPEEASMNDSQLPGPVDVALQPLADLAIQDLVQRLGIQAEEVELIEARSVVWPDASLGCPQPDMMYIQVPQEGALIRLRAKGRMYFYHSGESGDPILCEETSNIVPNATSKEDEMVPPPGSEVD